MTSCACPCGARYQVKETSVGKKARCKKCGTVFRLEPADDGIIPIKYEPAAAIPIAGALLDDTAKATIPIAGGAPPDFSDDIVRAATARLPSATSAGGFAAEAEEDTPEKPFAYVRSLAATILFPLSINNAIVLAFVVGVLFVSEAFIGHLSCYGLIIQFLVAGMYCAFRFKVIQEAVAGEPDLPMVTAVDGWYESAFVPFFSWLGTWAIALFPAAICLAVLAATDPSRLATVTDALMAEGIVGLLKASTATTFIWLACLLLGLFAWPMLALCVSVGGFETLSRPDLMVATVLRTFPMYLLTVVLVVGCDGLRTLTRESVADLNIANEGFLTSVFLVVATSVYLEIVGLRCIGLYYHHFKDRFAWSWG